MTYVRRPYISAGLFAIALTGAASAVLAPEFYEEARRSAASHLQIEIEEVSGPGGGMGDCMVEGKAVKIFKGGVEPGQPMRFTISCYDYGSIPDGATLWTDYDALKEAHYIEAFMSGGPNPRIALDQVEIILAPRDRPYCDDNSLYCESSVDSAARPEGCGFTGSIWNWLGLGAEECS